MVRMPGHQVPTPPTPHRMRCVAPSNPDRPNRHTTPPMTRATLSSRSAYPPASVVRLAPMSSDSSTSTRCDPPGTRTANMPPGQLPHGARSAPPPYVTNPWAPTSVRASRCPESTAPASAIPIPARRPPNSAQRRDAPTPPEAPSVKSTPAGGASPSVQRMRLGVFFPRSSSRPRLLADRRTEAPADARRPGRSRIEPDPPTPPPPSHSRRDTSCIAPTPVARMVPASSRSSVTDPIRPIVRRPVFARLFVDRRHVRDIAGVT